MRRRAALGATVETSERKLPLAELYRLPTDDDRSVVSRYSSASGLALRGLDGRARALWRGAWDPRPPVSRATVAEARSPSCTGPTTGSVVTLEDGELILG